MAGSNVMMSPFCASCIAWRKVPGPLSALLLTTIGTGVGVGDGWSGRSLDGKEVAVGKGLGLQPPVMAKAQEAANRNKRVCLFIADLNYRTPNVRDEPPGRRPTSILAPLCLGARQSIVPSSARPPRERVVATSASPVAIFARGPGRVLCAPVLRGSAPASC